VPAVNHGATRNPVALRCATVFTLCRQLSLPKMLSVANAFKIRATSATRANPATGCNNALH